MKLLVNELEKAGINSSLFCSDGVNNSTLGAIKRILMGLPSSKFDSLARFAILGSETHRAILEPHMPPFELYPEERIKADAMYNAALKHKPLLAILHKADKEILLKAKIGNVPVRGTLDIRKINGKKRIGADLKTTVCSSELEFYKAAIDYDYPRQGWFYSEIDQLDEFIFFGLQKQWPFKVFTMNLKDFPKEVNAAKEEAKFLLYIYEHYIYNRYEGAKAV